MRALTPHRGATSSRGMTLIEILIAMATLAFMAISVVIVFIIVIVISII